MSQCKHHISKFQDEKHKFCLNIFYANGWLTNFYTSKLKKFGITTQQYHILRFLEMYYSEPTSINLLKQCMPEKQSDVSRLIDRLVKVGLVERNICPLDRRKMDVIINQKGLELIRSISVEEQTWIDELINLSESDTKIVNQLLEILLWKE